MKLLALATLFISINLYAKGSTFSKNIQVGDIAEMNNLLKAVDYKIGDCKFNVLQSKGFAGVNIISVKNVNNPKRKYQVSWQEDEIHGPNDIMDDIGYVGFGPFGHNSYFKFFKQNVGWIRVTASKTDWQQTKYTVVFMFFAKFKDRTSNLIFKNTELIGFEAKEIRSDGVNTSFYSCGNTGI